MNLICDNSDLKFDSQQTTDNPNCEQLMQPLRLITAICLISLLGSEVVSQDPDELRDEANSARFGVGQKRDLNKALSLYKQAAAMGDNKSMQRIGEMYENGQGVSKSKKNAIDWYTKAAEKENGIAFWHLASLNQKSSKPENRKNSKKQFEKSFRLCKQAADAGDLRAMNYVGHMC